MRRYVPPQHGAWAMLLLPYLVALVYAGPVWVHLPLLVAWLAGYLFSYYALLALKTRRPARVRPQLVLYAAIAVPAMTVVLVARPELLALAPAYAGLLGVNAWYSWRRADRALVTGLASVVEGCLMVPVAAVAAGLGIAAVLEPFAVVLLYLAGTVLFVKTMIREREDTRYLRGSVAFHAVATVAAAALAWPLGLLFGWFLARAVSLPRRRLTPKRVGLLEVVNCVALLTVIALALR